MPAAGDIAPAFSALDQHGNSVSLADFAGKTVVLYFYPKDDTPGCTREACGFRDEFQSFTKKNVVILGVSPNDSAKHTKFIAKYSLPFTLLADPDKALCQAYDVWKEKNMYGKKSFGVVRSTFIIGPDGKIAKVFNNVKVDGHIAKVLEVV
jgi:peroxiredoxin Q/BCP